MAAEPAWFAEVLQEPDQPSGLVSDGTTSTMTVEHPGLEYAPALSAPYFQALGRRALDFTLGQAPGFLSVGVQGASTS